MTEADYGDARYWADTRPRRSGAAGKRSGSRWSRGLSIAFLAGSSLALWALIVAAVGWLN